MTLSDVERRILDLAVEDSYALSEIVSRLGDAFPKLASKEVKELTKETIRALYEKGLIEITKLEFPEGPEPAVRQNEALVALADDFNWVQLKHWRPHVRVVATAAGRAAFYARYA